MGKQRYTDEQRLAAIKLALTPGITINEAARKFDVKPATLRHWVTVQQRLARGVGTSPEPGLARIAEQVEEHKLTLIDVVDAVIREILGVLPRKLDEATFSELVEGADRLLDRVESMTYRPQQEDRGTRLARVLEERASDPRVQAAVAEALVRRGHLVALPSDGTAPS